MDTKYVHVEWTNGADDMVPERSAALLEKAGDLKIVDPTPGPYRRFKPRLPLGEPANTKSATPRKREPVSPQRKRRAAQVVTEPAPTQGAAVTEPALPEGAPTAEEATQ